MTIRKTHILRRAGALLAGVLVAFLLLAAIARVLPGKDFLAPVHHPGLRWLLWQLYDKFWPFLAAAAGAMAATALWPAPAASWWLGGLFVVIILVLNRVRGSLGTGGEGMLLAAVALGVLAGGGGLLRVRALRRQQRRRRNITLGNV